MSIADKLNNMVDELQDAYNAIEEMGGTLPAEKNYKNLKVAIESISPDPLANAYVILYTPGTDQSTWDYVEDASSVRAVLQGNGNVWSNPNNWTNLKFTEKCQKLDITSIGNSVTLAKNIQVIEGMDNLVNVTSIGSHFMDNGSSTNTTLTNINSLPPKLETIGAYFLFNCGVFNQQFELPSTLLSIGTYFLGFCNKFNQPVVVPSKVTVIPDNFLRSCTDFRQTVTLPNGLATIGDHFLSSTAFNQPLTIPNTVTSIGGYFLGPCTAFNSTLTLSTALTKIGQNFLFNGFLFNKAITLPSSLTSIQGGFLSECRNFTSTVNVGSLSSAVIESSDTSFATTQTGAASYTMGITLSGSSATSWKAKFPDSNVSPYRKLLVA